MSLNNVPPGKNVPDTFNVVIEIPMNADPIKYEVDKESGAIFVDRFMTTAMHYPTNYGYVPQTLSGDGDPVDVLVITPYPLHPGVVVTCRPLGILMMEDEAGVDGKVLAVPTTKMLRCFNAATCAAFKIPKAKLATVGASSNKVANWAWKDCDQAAGVGMLRPTWRSAGSSHFLLAFKASASGCTGSGSTNKFMAKGLDVRLRIWLTPSRICCGEIMPQAKLPKPPALLTAATNWGEEAPPAMGA